MTTKFRFKNKKYRLEIRERDHNPPHVHLVGGEFDVFINLDTCESEGKWPQNLKTEVMQWIDKNKETLMEEWNKWHK